jgi:hypothetical protein
VTACLCHDGPLHAPSCRFYDPSHDVPSGEPLGLCDACELPGTRCICWPPWEADTVIAEGGPCDPDRPWKTGDGDEGFDFNELALRALGPREVEEDSDEYDWLPLSLTMQRTL